MNIISYTYISLSLSLYIYIYILRMNNNKDDNNTRLALHGELDGLHVAVHRHVNLWE